MVTGLVSAVELLVDPVEPVELEPPEPHAVATSARETAARPDMIRAGRRDFGDAMELLFFDAPRDSPRGSRSLRTLPGSLSPVLISLVFPSSMLDIAGT